MASFNFQRSGIHVPLVSTSHRTIQSVIPAPGTEEILERLEKVESRSMHGQIPLVWDRAEDFSIFDHFGNKWIDFTSTIFVANVGHSNPRVLETIQETISKPILACYAYPNSIRADYLENLLKFAGPSFEKAFLLSAGTETTEAAMKLMKLHGKKMGKKKNLVVSITGNWHGRTLGAQVLSSNPSQREWITNPNSETIQIAFPYPETMKKSPEEFLEDSLDELAEQGIDISEDVCGFLLETFQGWGAYFYPTDYVKKIREICDKNEILLAFDEMQSGFGRTGLNFGYEHYGVKADLLCCGKGMGGGLPLSGVIGSAKVMDLPEVGNMSSTHSGNPLLCAVGSAVLEELNTKNLVKNSSVNGNVLHNELNKLKERFPEDIQQINGKGLIAAIIFSSKYKQAQHAQMVSEITEKCFQKGLLVVHTGRESIKIGPPLTITQEAIVEGVNVILEAMQEVLG